MKYFLLGAFATGFLLYGIAVLYGATGSTAYATIAGALSTAPRLLVLGGVALLIVALGFKVSAVPFHFWTPDTYEGAPTPVTAFLSTASKAGGFVALLTIIRTGFFPSQDSWEPVLWVLAASSIIFGKISSAR